MQEAEAGGSLALTLTEIRGEKYKEEYLGVSDGMVSGSPRRS